MKKSFHGRALRLMAMSPLALLCLAPGLGAQELDQNELDLSQEEVAIERVAREEVKPISSLEPAPLKPFEVEIVAPEIPVALNDQIGPEEPQQREPVETVNELTPGEVQIADTEPSAPELLTVPVEEERREPVEPVNELEPGEVVLVEPEIEAPLISAEEIERAANQVIEASEEEEEDDVLADLELENQGLETQVCEQRQRISTLEEEIVSLQNQATDYMPLLNTMNQLMMMNMNMMMMNQQNQLSFQTSPLDMMGSMMAPMMMMQSMSMGMSIASMNNLYHQPSTPMRPQYNYNIGGDFYGRDYSMVQESAPVQAPYATPYGFDFGGRSPSFTAITPAAGPTGATTQTEPPQAGQPTATPAPEPGTVN